MRIRALGLLLVLASAWAAGCQQDQKLAEPQRESLYGAPRNVSWGIEGTDEDGYRMGSR